MTSPIRYANHPSYFIGGDWSPPLRSRGGGSRSEPEGSVSYQGGTMKPYNDHLLSRARSMRREMTPAEMRLWLDCLAHLPYKFRRQRPFGKFIVDFCNKVDGSPELVCAKLKLVIEVDGDSHFSEQAIAYDDERTQFLESLGLRILRFTNDEVFRNLDAVREKILSLTPPSLRDT